MTDFRDMTPERQSRVLAFFQAEVEKIAAEQTALANEMTVERDALRLRLDMIGSPLDEVPE